MTLTRTVSSPTAFSDAECEAYFNLLSALPPHALVVEIGLQYGRSSSIALQVCRERNLRYWGVDPFNEPDSPDACDKWRELAHSILPSFKLSRMRSNEVILGEPVDVLLIDGDHSREGVAADCAHFLPRVREGGYALFHDYQRESLPGVTEAVGLYMDGNRRWVLEGVVETLGIWRRL